MEQSANLKRPFRNETKAGVGYMNSDGVKHEEGHLHIR